MQPYFSATNGLIVSEDDVRRLFLRRPKCDNQKIIFPRFIRVILTLLILIVLSYIALNAPAIFVKTKFSLQNVTKNQSEGVAPSIPTPSQNTPVNSNPTDNHATIPDNHLMIDRLHVNAPVNWGVDGENNDLILQSLQTGVSQLKSSALPNQFGNVFIVGHSSNYLWAKGNYKHVFALLPQVVIGDAVKLTYQNQLFEYRVTEVKTVKPSDVSIIKGDGKAHLTLMTCVPLGTSLKRLVVVADPINVSSETIPAKISAPISQSLLPVVR